MTPQTPHTTVDLLTELDELREIAKDAQRRLDAGMVANGRTALRRIEMKASDAIRWSNTTTTAAR